MKSTSSISILHVIFLSMTVIGLKNHVTIIPPLLLGAGRDGWISVLLAAVFIIPWLFLLLHIHRKSNQKPMTEWLEDQLGKGGSTFIRYLVAIFLLIICAFTMAETLHWITATFLPESPLLLMLILYTIVCILLVSTSLQTIVMVNAFVLFWVVVLGFFVAITNIQVKDYTLLRPFLEHGFGPVLSSMVFPASGYVELLLFIFIQHKVKKRFKWYHFSLMLFIIMGLTLGPLIGAITEFGPAEAAKQRYPAYEEWGLVSVGRFIEHLDFLSIYQWLTGAFVRMSVILYIVAELLKINEDKKLLWKGLAPAIFFLSLSLCLMSNQMFIKVKGEYVLTITFFFMFSLAVFLWIVSLFSGSASKKLKDKPT